MRWKARCPRCGLVQYATDMSQKAIDDNFARGINYMIVVCSDCNCYMAVRSTGESSMLESCAEEFIWKQWMSAARSAKPLHPLIEVLP